MPRDAIHLCESCHRRTDLTYARGSDQYLCEDCLIAAHEEYLRSLQPPRLPLTEAELEEAAYEASKDYFDRYIAGDH